MSGEPPSPPLTTPTPRYSSVFFSVGTPLPGVEGLTGDGGAMPGVRLEPEPGVLVPDRLEGGGTV